MPMQRIEMRINVNRALSTDCIQRIRIRTASSANNNLLLFDEVENKLSSHDSHAKQTLRLFFFSVYMKFTFHMVTLNMSPELLGTVNDEKQM